MHSSGVEFTEEALASIIKVYTPLSERISMTIDLYSKKGCERCETAQSHIESMGYNYNYHDIEYHTSPHDGWQDDGSIEVMAHAQMDSAVPAIKIGDSWFRYTEAMKILKKIKRAV